MSVRTMMALVWSALATVAWADPDSDLQALRSQRDALLGQLLEQRQALQSGDGVYVLRLDGAAEGFDVKLSLPRHSGKWLAGQASVPWWQQETQKEKFSFLHRNGSQSMHREKFTFPAETGKMELASAAPAPADRQLRGTVKVNYRLDLPARLRMPPGGAHLYTTDGRWSLLDQWYVGSRTIDRPQQLHLSAEVSETARYVELVLAGGIDGRPLHLRCLVPYEPFSAVEVVAPQWNAGRHEADVTGLKFADDKLTGRLRVKFNPDPWFPKNAWFAVYDLDVDCRLGRATGRYSATISEGDFVKVPGQNKSGNRPSRDGPADFAGEVTGIVARAVTGQYTTEGELEDRRGLLRGGVLPYLPDPKKALAKPAGTSAQQATRIYNQIRALRRVLADPGTPLDTALAMADRPAPSWAGTSQTNEQAYVRAVSRLVRAGKDTRSPLPNRGWPAATNPHFGPYYGAKALLAEKGVPPLPAPIGVKGPQVWGVLSEWQVLGPFPQPVAPAGMQADLAVAPEASYAADVERLGDHYKGPERLTWQMLQANSDGRLTPPGWTWSKRGKVTEPGRADTFWYATCTLASPSEQSVWLAVEAWDNASLWVNGLLAWEGTERQKNYQRPGPAVFQVHLGKGENRLLLRVRDDRADSFARVHVCTGGTGVADHAPAPAPRPADRKSPADPPIAWNLADGTNVGWSTDVAGAQGTPLAVEDKVYLAAGPHHLVCLDPRTGKQLWRGSANVLELIAPDDAKTLESAEPEKARQLLAKHLGKEMTKGGIDLSDPVSDGKRIYLHVGTGVLACFDVQGKRLWMVRTHMPAASITPMEGKVVLEGPAGVAWAQAFDVDAKGLSERKQGKAGHNYGSSENHTLRRLADLHSGKHHAMMALEAASGKALWQATPRGTYAGAPMVLTVPDAQGQSRRVLLSRAGQVFSPGGTCLRDDVDLGTWDWLSATSHGHRAFSAWEGGRAAAEFWMDGAGLGYRRIWRATRLHAYVAGGANDGLADGEQFYVWRRVWEHAKHCPAYALELDVFDAYTGRRTGQIKPAVRHTNRAVQPVKVGDLLYLPDHRGGPHSGGEPDERQVTVTSAGPDPVLLASNLTPNVSAGPVPAGGNSLVFRCGQRVACVRVDGKEGEAYQERTLARHVLERIYRTPAGSDLPKIVPSDKLPPAGSPLTVLREGQNLIDWLVAGPLPEGSPPTVDLDKPFRPGDVFSAGIHKERFRPIPADLVSVTTSFHNDGRLDDWQVRRVTGRIDLSALPTKGPSVHYLACTLLQPRDGLAILTTDAKGLTAILGGTHLQAGRPVELAKGTYSLVLRVDPSQFKRRQPLPPTDVSAAIKGGAASEIGWPGTWTVHGPMGPAAGMPEPAQLKRVAKSWTLGGSDYRAIPVGSIERSLDLTSIVGLAPGQAPKVGKQVQQRMVNQQLTAWALTEIEAPADGTLLVNASADWFMEWYVDGERVYSTLSGGNKRAPTQVTAHSFAVPLTMGKHVVAVRSKPGSKGWSVTSLGAFVPGELSDARALHEKYPAKGGVAGAEPEWRVAVTFAKLDPPADVEAVRARQVNRARAWLKRIVEKLPGSDEAGRAEALLKLTTAE